MLHNRAPISPKENQMFSTAVVSEVNGYTFGVWGLSGDDEGQEILAILLDVLSTGFVELDKGTPEEFDQIPVGIPEPLIVGRGIDDVAILSVTLSAKPGSGLGANDLTRIARSLQAEVAKTEDVGLTYLVGDATDAIRIAPDPERLALYGVTLQQLAGKVSEANRTLNTGKLRDKGEQIDLVAGKTLTAPAEPGSIVPVRLTARSDDRMIAEVTA